MAGHCRGVWLGLPAGFLYEGRTQENWSCCFILPQTLHSVEALHLPMPDTSALPWEWVSLTHLSHWITYGFRAVCLSLSPLEHREAHWCISCRSCWLLSLIQGQ